MKVRNLVSIIALTLTTGCGTLDKEYFFKEVPRDFKQLIFGYNKINERRNPIEYENENYTYCFERRTLSKANSISQ